MTLFMLLIFLLSMWTLAILISQTLRVDMQRLLGDQQFATVSYVAEDVNREISERLQVLEFSASQINSTMLNNPAAMQNFSDQRILGRFHFNDGIFVLNQSGMVVADTRLTHSRIGENYLDRDYVQAVLRQGKTSIGQAVIDKKSAVPMLSMAAPIHDQNHKVIGVLVGVTLLEHSSFFSLLSNNWQNRKGYFLLVDPKNRMILTSSDRSRIMQPLPAPDKKPHIENFMGGKEGTEIHINTAGKEVLASAKWMPAAGWFVASVLPTTEAFYPIQVMQQRIFLSVIILTLLVCMLTWWMIKRQLTPMLEATEKLVALADSDEQTRELPVTRQDEIGALINAFNVILKNLGDRKKSLINSKLLKQDILDSIPAQIVVLDQQANIIAVNEPWQRSALENSLEPGKPAANTGLGDNYLAALQNVDQYFTGNNNQDAYSGIRDVLGGKLTQFSIEYPRHSSEQRRWFNMDVRALSGTVQKGVVITHVDITERKFLEEKQEELYGQVFNSAQEIRDLYQKAPCGYHSLDRDGKIQRINHTELKWLGYKEEEVVGKKNFADILTPRSIPVFRSSFAKFMQQGEIHNVELELVRKDGSCLPVNFSASAIYDETGEFLLSRSTLYDMTEHKKMNQERAGYIELLKDASHHIVSAQENERRRLAGELHDRTSPNLAAIQINLNLIEGELTMKEFENLRDQLEDTRALLEDTTLSIREICTDMRPPLLDYAGLPAAIEAYAARFTQRTQIAVHFECATPDKRLEANLESMLFRVLQEALTNTSKHAKASSIYIKFDNNDGNLLFTIQDDGIGYDHKELLQRSSIGLGLINMREMAHVAGCYLDIKSAPGKGTKIVVEIPHSG